MEDSRIFSRNTVGDNATVNQNNVTHITVNAAASNADRSFLQEISKTNPFHDKKDILMRKGPLLQESFCWILDHEDFSRWRHNEETGVFWIKGDAGKGKTMLLCGIIEEFEKNSPSTNLAYFFCQATDYRNNTAAAVIGGLIFSLLKRRPALLLRIREKYEDGPKGQLGGDKAFAVLSDIFETIVQDSALTELTCVVDALDECIKDCDHLLNLIIKTSSNVKWLLSSRNEKHIETRLITIPQRLVLELKQNAELISASIEVYINHHIRKILALQGDEELQSETLYTLKSKASGTFLWVALVIEQLHNTDHLEVQDVLEEMPEGLGSIYGLILSRIDKLREKAREACQTLLSIVIAAKRPLHLRELLVFINSHWNDNGHFKTSYQLRDLRDMTRNCGSIPSIRDDIVYFIHQSAKDYIVQNAAQCIFPIEHQHYKMFETSLDAMSNVLTYDIYNLKDPGIHIDDIPQQSADSDPLASIRYCCVFWVEHLVHGYEFNGFEHWKYIRDDQRLHSFLKEKFLCWAESLALMDSFIPHAQLAFQKVKNIMESYCAGEGNPISQPTKYQRERETQNLRQFVNDALQFIAHSNEFAGYWPLQLYFAAIGFEPNKSAIRKTFERTVRDKFGPSPTALSISQSQSSLLMRTIVLPRTHGYSTVCDYLLFSPDSVFLCTLQSSTIDSFNSIFTLWRVETGYLECSIQAEVGSKIAFFPDSKHLISISRKGVIRKWDVGRGSCIQEQTLGLSQDTNSDHIEGFINLPPFPKEEVIALSPNGDLVATLSRTPDSRTRIIKVWETKSASCGCTFTSDDTSYAAFSPNSELLVLVHASVIIIRHSKNGQEIKHLTPGYFYFNFLESRPIFSPNSRILVTRRSASMLNLWDTNTWSLLHQVEATLLFRSLELIQPAISPDSAILAVSAQYGFELWSIDTGKCIARISGARLSSMIFSPDWIRSSLVALQSDHEVIQIRQANINQRECEVEDHGQCTFTAAAISPDSRIVASNHGCNIKIYNGDDGQLVRVLEGVHEKYNYLQAFSLDSELLAFYYKDPYFQAFVQIWRIVTGECISLIVYKRIGPLSSIAFSVDSKYLVAGNIDGEILLWRIDSGQCVYKYSVFLDSMLSKISSVAISPDSRRVVGVVRSPRGNDGWLHIQRLHTYEHDNEHITLCHSDYWNGAGGNVAFSADSTKLASITGQDVLIWDVSTGARLKRFQFHCDEHLKFYKINSWIFTDALLFYQTSSWKHWEPSSRLGYSYVHYPNYASNGIYYPNYANNRVGEAWILLDEKKNFYMPTEFRERLNGGDGKLAMSGSLLALVNELAGLVIVKLPTQREPPQQAIGDLDPDIGLGVPTLEARDLNLDVAVPVTDDSDQRASKRKRVV